MFNVAMQPLLAKLNCLPIDIKVRPYQLTVEKFFTKQGIPIYRNIASAYADDIISVVKLDLRHDDPKLIIDKKLEIYSKLSLVFGLKIMTQ